MTEPLTIDQIIGEFRDLLTDVESAIERRTQRNVLFGENSVVRTSPGLYLRRIEAGKYQPNGILHASIWAQRDAERIAAVVEDGAGNRGEAVFYVQALCDERDELIRLIEWAESRRKPYAPGALPNSVDESLEASHVGA